jgi:hypothetical protein
VDQAVEHLLSKHKALKSNSRTTTTTKKKKKKASLRSYKIVTISDQEGILCLLLFLDKEICMERFSQKFIVVSIQYLKAENFHHETTVNTDYKDLNMRVSCCLEKLKIILF